jgi:hypothetical protein
MGKNMKGHFMETDIHMGNKHMERSTSLAMLIKTTKRYHYKTIIRDKIKKS